MARPQLLVAVIIAMAGSSTAWAGPQPDVKSKTASSTIPGRASDYRLGPFDKITVRVFGEEKLSVEKLQIDAGGQIILPLAGPIDAGGKTAAELSSEIAARLGARYLRNPQVSVQLEEAVSQRVTVSGAVVESGVYTLKGPTTLMQALAMAKGPDVKLADLKHVAVFRQVDGHNSRAVFDLKSIRSGAAEDPQVQGGDSIVVEGSAGKQFWRELITALPGLGIFAYF